LVALLCYIGLGPGRPAQAVSVRSGDTIWLIDTRGAGCCSEGAERCLSRLRVLQCGGNHQWQRRTWAEFFGSDDARATTMFWVHGNRVSSSEARRRGLAMYQAMSRNGSGRPSLRFVIWSWPATRIRGPLRDIRAKAARTGPAGYHLAAVLDRIDADVPLRLAGFSYGARVITGALHLLDGGRFSRYELASGSSEKKRKVRAVLLAAAVHSHWLEPGRYHGRSLNQLDRLVLLNNGCDPALQRYRFLDPCGRPSALGYTGVASLRRLGEQADKVEQIRVNGIVGRTHHAEIYIRSRRAMELTRRGLFDGVQTFRNVPPSKTDGPLRHDRSLSADGELPDNGRS